MKQNYSDKYLKYKSKYDKLVNFTPYDPFKRNMLQRTNSSDSDDDSESHNMFYYLDNYKKKVLDLAKKSYCDPKLVSKGTLEGMFMKWYLNSIKGDYIPQDMTHVKSDLKYQYKKVNCNRSTDDIITDINKETANLNTIVKKSKKEYIYKPIFSELQLKMLKNKYTGPEEDFIMYRNFLSELYDFMGGFNNHMSIPPELISDETVELFGTPVNTKNKYCSPFKIEKDFFGSYGSFFDYELKSGVHIANPPFDEDIMNRMSNRLNDQLDKHKDENIDIVIVIPKWDNLNAFDNIIKSKYMIKHKIIYKNKGLFFNYYKMKFIPVVDCHCIHLSNFNTKFSIDTFIYKWIKMFQKID